MLFAVPAWAASPEHPSARAQSEAELKKIEAQQKEKELESKKLAAASAKIQTEVEKLKTKLVTVSRRLEEHEEKRDELQAELFNTTQEQAKLSEEHRRSQSGLSQVLAVLLRLAQLPPGAMVFSEKPPSETIDTTIGIHAILSELNQRVADERKALAALAAVEVKLRAQQAAVAEAEAKIAADRVELSALLKQRESARQKTEVDRVATEEAAKALAAQASDLRELIQQLRAREAALRAQHHRAKPPKISNAVLAAAGSARLPVVGTISRGYGEADSAGNHARGITLITQADAVVSAPREGQVVFAGPFRSYGQVVIIEVAEGAHILLTGLGKIDVAEGENVKAGEPVGRMPSDEGRLYLEARKDGEPVDPATFGLTQSNPTKSGAQQETQ